MKNICLSVLMASAILKGCGKSDDGSSSPSNSDQKASGNSVVGYWYGGNELSSERIVNGRFLKIAENSMELKAKCMHSEVLEALVSSDTQVKEGRIEILRTASTNLNINGRKCAAILRQGTIEYRFVGEALLIKKSEDGDFRTYRRISKEEYKNQKLPN